MIPVSTDYRQQLIAGNRRWVIKVPVTLKGSNSPDFTLTNEHIWDNGIVLDNAISSDTSFDLGAAIVGSLKVTIDNINGNFSQYDFYDAKLTLWLGVEGDLDSGVQRYYRIGFYVVDVPTYNGSLITLNCLDNMIWFDTPFKEVTGITYPATAETVVRAMCNHVGVTLSNGNFPNHSDNNTKVLAAPEEDLTCRDVLQYIAQMCCCYCKINTAGQLVLTWYDKTAITGRTGYDGGTFNTTTTPYSDGDDVQGGRWYWDGDTYVWENLGSYDGGTFTDLQNNAYLSQNFEIEVSTDDIVVTGCRVRNNRSKESAYDVLWVDSTLEQTHDRYVLVIDDNPFITTQAKANAIANIVGQTLAELPMRGFTATSLADFSIETGDMATIVDFRGNTYYTWITHYTFTTNNSENFSCGVQSVKKRSEQRFSTLAESIEKARVAIDAYDAAVAAMNELAQNSIGYREYYYPDETSPLSSRVTYRYNGTTIDTTNPANPKFPNSSVVFKISGDGVFVSTSKNSQGYQIWTNGYDANSGTAILNLLYAQGLNAKWIKAGSIDASVITVTNLNASNITSGTMSADKINGGTINGNNVNVTNLNASNITSGTMSANKINGGTINGNNVSVTNISASNITSGTMSADKINGGTINGNNVSVTNISASNITSGTMSADKINGGSINANNVTITNLNASNITSGSLSCDRLDGGTINGQKINGGEIKGSDIWSNNGDNYVRIYGGMAYFINPNSVGSGDPAIRFSSGTGANKYEIGYGSYESFAEVPGYTKTVASYKIIKAADSASDRRLKTNIKELSFEEAWAYLTASKTYSFYFKDSAPNEKRFGLIAQEFKKGLDEYGEDTNNLWVLNKNENDGMYCIELKELVPHLIKVVTTQQEEIDLLKQEVALLKKKVGV